MWRVWWQRLIRLKITHRNFNQLESAFRHPPKTVPRGLQIPSQLASCFEYPFLSILGASWVDFWWVLGAKLGAKFTKKSIIWPLVGKMPDIAKNTKFADSSTLLIVFWFLGPPTSKQNWQKSVLEPIKNQAKKWSASWSNFWWILEPTWFDFGRVFAAKLEPSWDQMLPTPDPKTNQKKYYFLEGLWIYFGWILVPTWPPKS